MKQLVFILCMLAFGACNDHSPADEAEIVVYEYEGEYRVKGGTPQFTICTSNKTFQVVGTEKIIADINISYNNYINIPESPIRAFMIAKPEAIDIHKTGFKDSVLVVYQMKKMIPYQRCPQVMNGERPFD